MKFRKHILFTLILVLFLVSMVPAAFAATSDATVTFSVDGSPDILDPRNPNQPLPELDGGVTGETGLLTLDYVSSVNFGSQEVSMSEQTYSSETTNPFIQVTDRRGGGGLGWGVTAQASTFTETTSSEPGLEGATITFSGTVAASKTDNTSSTPESVAPEIVLVTGDTDPVSVITSTEGQGLGSWIIKWLAPADATTNDKVTLTVPDGAATAGTFTSTITWTLADTPTTTTP